MSDDRTPTTPPADRPVPLSSTTPPTLRRPSAPPRHPTDQRRPNLLAGRISRGGDGPCYGLVTDDGREYALHGPGMGTFATGVTVLVTVGPADPTASCGPGTPVGIVTISLVR